VARDLPGDDPTIDWASPWAGASFIAGGTSITRERRMQEETFREFWKWSQLYPESSIRRITIEDFFDDEDTDIWWKVWVPEVKLPQSRILQCADGKLLVSVPSTR
jgi:D-amino-acid oxidase